MATHSHPLYVAILWHLHQPFYKDLATAEYQLPWVRLHAIKDYYAMAALVKDFPGLKINFNIVPSLLDQVEDYAHKEAIDQDLMLSLKSSLALDPKEKATILAHFFSANWETMINPFPRYRQLLHKRGTGGDKERWAEVHRLFSPQDLLDLQVWYNLTWFNSALREADPLLRDLLKKGRGFSEEEKILLLSKQREITSQIIPLYRLLLDQGQIDISTSPYYHPILPLLCDTDVAKESAPDILLPERRFCHPEDAVLQIERALEAYHRHFQRPSQGMWPSEGAVSQEMAYLVARAGIGWIASDEEILYRSLGLPFSRANRNEKNDLRLLYQPYSIVGSNYKLDILFRDHLLSDLIGFTYSRWDPQRAAADFIDRLYKIKRDLEGFAHEGPFLVTIILDGENAWEYYRNDGRDFLSFLYEGLMRSDGLESVAISDFLKGFPPRREISAIASGSWIDHNFRIWIGHREDNRAWDLLHQTRDDLAALESVSEKEGEGGGGNDEGSSKAWEEIYIAEGSDWTWWYGDDHNSGMDEAYDSLFRKHLMNVYRFMGVEVPNRLFNPILGDRGKEKLTLEPAFLMNPCIDGKVTNYFEWLSAAAYETLKSGDVMHRAHVLMKGLRVGFDLDRMFLRIDLKREPSVSEVVPVKCLQVDFLAPYPIRVEFQLEQEMANLPMRIYAMESIGPVDSLRKEIEMEGWEAAFGEIVEIGVPFGALHAESDQDVQFVIVLRENGGEQERWPRSGFFTVKVPSSGFGSDHWQA